MTVIKSYKGFNRYMKCRDFQFEIGKEYTHNGDVKACNQGFHACEYPLDVFGYYPPAESVFCTVEQSGKISKHDCDSKVASSNIKIIGRIDIAGMVKAAIDFTMSNVKKDKKKSSRKTGERTHSINTGSRSAAINTGSRSAAINTGNYSAASNTGDQSAASNTGDYSAASNTGDQSAAINTGYQSAAINTGSRSAAINTGNYSAAINTGDQSAASNTGDYSAASTEGTCKESIAAGFGYQNKAKASAGNWIVLAHRSNDGVILHLKTAKAGVDITPDTWYMLDADGLFVAV